MVFISSRAVLASAVWLSHWSALWGEAAEWLLPGLKQAAEERVVGYGLDHAEESRD